MVLVFRQVSRVRACNALVAAVAVRNLILAVQQQAVVVLAEAVRLELTAQLTQVAAVAAAETTTTAETVAAV